MYSLIQFSENQKSTWNEFIAENNSESFLQSWEWGKFQRALGRKIWRLGIAEKDSNKENKDGKLGNLVCAALIVKHNLPFGRSYLYCPRGPVIINTKYQIPNTKQIPNCQLLLNFLFEEIKKIAEKEKSLFLRIDPPMEWKLEIGNLSSAPIGDWKLENSSLKKSPSEVQPRDTLMLDLAKQEEGLLKEMKAKTRYNIRLAEKKELRIKNYELRITNREVFKKKFEKFWELMKETARRDGFKSHSKDYYWKMLESFSSDGTNEGDIPECRLKAKLYLAEYKDKIIAANIVLFFGDLCVYLHGASSNEHRNVMAPYILQWLQILDAKKAGCRIYDFWGIDNNLKFKVQSMPSRTIGGSKFKSGEKDWSGITRFKKGFGGYEKNYVGAYDLVFDKLGCKLYKFAKLARSYALKK